MGEEFTVAEIVPVSQLEDIFRNKCFMCLAQVAAESEAYRGFHKHCLSEGKFVVLDNGECEGKRLSDDELVEMIKEIRPHEFILPDVMCDAEATLESTMVFLDEHPNLNYKLRLMGVPHGKTLEEWEACAYVMIADKRIRTIGVPKVLSTLGSEKQFGDDFKPYAMRWHAVKYVQEQAEKMGRKNLRVHLLGMNEKPIIVKRIAYSFPIVRSCDTAYAWLAAQVQKPISKDMTRPESRIDVLKDEALPSYPMYGEAFQKLFEF